MSEQHQISLSAATPAPQADEMARYRAALEQISALRGYRGEDMARVAVYRVAAEIAEQALRSEARLVPTSDEVEKYKEARGEEWGRAYDALRHFRLWNIRDEDGCGYPLVDLMTRDGVQITDGQMELVDMVDTIFSAIRAPSRQEASNLVRNCRQLLDIIENYDLTGEMADEDREVIEEIRAATEGSADASA